jgi:hypothetical protein
LVHFQQLCGFYKLFFLISQFLFGFLVFKNLY